MVRAPVVVFADALTHEVKRFVERTRVLPDVARIAVMPDVHLAGEACVGTVVATHRTLRPHLLGSDLGCGVSALPLSVRADILEDPRVAARILAGLEAAVPLLARSRASPDSLALDSLWSDSLWSESLSHGRLMRARDREGVREHGTVGRGNHFVELQEDDEGMLWVMVHSGSRALGPLIQSHHVGSARPRDVVLHVDSAEGQAYLADVNWAVRYAASSRRRMALAVAAVVEEHGGRIDPPLLLDCHHDAIAHELHDGAWYWVHRKGAVPAPAGAVVLVPGSMGTASFHCEGRGEPTSMASSAHGAGRAMPRGEAMRAIGPRRLAAEIEGVIVDPRRLGDLRDEAPSAYKDIDAVMRAQRSLTKQVRRLRPRLVHK